jgi:hypothetical protein
MSEPRVVTLQSLLRRLEDVLGRDSLLYKRFEQGFQREDEKRLTEAMTSLKLYPTETRSLVEDTMMSWLFGQREAGERSAAAGPKH